MKLTMERVRALRAAMSLAAIGTTDEERKEAGFDVALALCDEWIEARTVRWGDSDAEERSVLTGRGFSGFVAFNGDDWGPWGASVDGVHWRTCATEPEARAWLEEQARAAGYEVSRG